MTEVLSRTVAFVAGEPVPAARVEERLDALRTGERAGVLPRGGKEFRQLRRWVGQVVVTETLCELAVRRTGTPPVADPSGSDDLVLDGLVLDGLALDDVAAVELGSLAATVLAASPYARRVYRQLSDDVQLPESEAEGYYRRNADLFLTAEARASGGDAVRPFAEVRDDVRDRLRAAAARQAFLRWIDEQTAALVELCPGWEHPGDPAQPDNTHRH